MTGIGWGLPNAERNWSLHPDEPIVLIYSQQINPAQGDFDPDFYNYGTLYLTMSRIASTVADAYGGELKTPHEQMRRDHLAGRGLSAVAGAAMAWVVFALLFRRGVHPTGAIMGAAAVAISPGLVVHSQFQTVDVVAALWTTLALYWGLRALDDPLKPCLYTGLFAGLAAGTKYSGIVVLFVLAPLMLRKEWRGPLAAVGVALLTFVLTTPGAVLHTKQFLRDFRYEMWHTSTGHGLVFAETAPGALYHLSNLFEAFGVGLTLMALIGVGLAMRGKWKPDDTAKVWMVGLLAFSVVYYVLIARAEVKFLRYVFPLIPVLAVTFGWLMGAAAEQVKTRWGWVVAGIMALVGLAGGGLSRTTGWLVMMRSDDPRDAAAAYLRQEGKSVGLVSDAWFYSPSLFPNAQVPRAMRIDQRLVEQRAAQPPVVQSIPANPAERFDWDSRLITDLKPEYIVFSSFETEGLERMASRPGAPPPAFATQVERYRAFSRLLNQEYGLHRTFGLGGPEVHDLMYIRPTLWIWKRLNSTSTTSSMTSPSSAASANTP